MLTDVTQLDKLAMRIPGGEPVLERAWARRAAELVSAALEVDPRLLDHDRSRDLDICAELLRQLHPLARQAALTLEHGRLTETRAGFHEEPVALPNQARRRDPFPYSRSCAADTTYLCSVHYTWV